MISEYSTANTALSWWGEVDLGARGLESGTGGVGQNETGEKEELGDFRRERARATQNLPACKTRRIEWRMLAVAYRSRLVLPIWFASGENTKFFSLFSSFAAKIHKRAQQTLYRHTRLAAMPPCWTVGAHSSSAFLVCDRSSRGSSWKL